jgi:cysteine synthase A
MLTSGTEQQRNADGSPAAGHPAWNPHPIQGWSPDFIPKLTGDAIAAKYVDRILTIPAPEAVQWSKKLAAQEGIFVGVSAGGTFGAAMKVCADAPNGSTVLAMLPDTGERYLSTGLFADIPADMTEEEQAIAMSIA